MAGIIVIRKLETNEKNNFIMIETRLKHLVSLGEYLKSDSPELSQAKELAERNNAWFTKEFIQHALNSIVSEYLNEEKLREFSLRFSPLEEQRHKNVGIVMAGNIPLVGFHDLLCVYLSGHPIQIKLSSKDDILMKHVAIKLQEIDGHPNGIQFKQMLRDADAYIATGSNQSASVFKEYFSRFPNIIRKSKTSVAILTGEESEKELEALADDVYMYFGLGCRNVTKIYVPTDYDFVPLLNIFRKYDELKNHNKYRNNFDYQLALYILNNQPYMSNDSLLMIENASMFSAVSVLHYEYYSNLITLRDQLHSSLDIQAIISRKDIPFGSAQTPSLSDFADGVDTVAFLNSL